MDIISELPDELLLKILLLVPTQVAASTSILSKRWEYLWMWLPKLEYDLLYCSESEAKMLQCFLDRNLPLHRAPVIESFRLELCSSSHFKPESIHMWILTAVSHCLRELDILYESYPDKPNILPSNLYTCNSLVILKLEGWFLLDVPRMVSLSSLKTLKLKRVKFFNEETLQQLLSNCPVLEDLVVDLRDYDDETAGKLTVSVPSLQSLSLFIHSANVLDGYVIETPSLKYFNLRDHSWHDHYGLIESMPYLIEAHLDCGSHDINSVIGSITSVKRLAICSETILDEGFVFNQLEHLEVCLCQEHIWNQLVRLLKSSSNLQGLHLFVMDGCHDTGGMGEWNQPSTVPECLLTSLESLGWSFYYGEPEERDILVYILKHALRLKTATINYCESDVRKHEVLKELAVSSRASAACQLILE